MVRGRLDRAKYRSSNVTSRDSNSSGCELVRLWANKDTSRPDQRKPARMPSRLVTGNPGSVGSEEPLAGSVLTKCAV